MTGGLGNQMFQYAIGRVLALKNRTSLKLDLSNYTLNSLIDTPRKYELDKFDLPISIYKKNFLTLQFPPKIIHEISQAYDKSILNLKGNIKLIGYWQSEKYFSAYRDLIIKEFTFKTQPSGKNKKLLQDIIWENSIGVHVRRGDYVTIKTANECHGTCSLTYYEAAIKFIKQKVKNPIFYVFSDDIPWCKDNLIIEGKVVYIDHNHGENSWEDMRLMSHCKHNIIANSSFSWWSAWLNTNDTKIVIAPKLWFQARKMNSQSIVPQDWIKL